MRGRDGRASHRGGRGGRVQRPRNAYTTNAEGEQTHDKVNKPRKPFIGKSREEAHPYDRRSGTGRGKRDQQKGGHGKGNWGEEKPVYKVKGSEEEEEKEATEEPKKEVKEEPKVEEPVVEVIEVGTTLADFKKNKAIPAKKEARKAEDITGSNI